MFHLLSFIYYDFNRDILPSWPQAIGQMEKEEQTFLMTPQSI